MHGRLKVKTSAQQDAEKKAMRIEKLKIYRGAMEAILSRRSANDELQLKMTSGLLMANPDITTLWNIRKEAVQQIIEDCDDAKKEEILRHEMDLSQECLLSNPKSYGSWHHRAWCLEKMSNPNWQTELSLCSRYLSMDERNFHCWDHRRYVTKRSAIDDMEELKYSTERINVNFSNYSAWHYRSKLIPKVFPPSTESSIGVMDEATRREELELVQNAAFTDPEDSSAWYYHKWLLQGGKSEDFSNTHLTMIAIDHDKKRLLLAFSKLVLATETCKIVCDHDVVESTSVTWEPAVHGEAYDSLWIVTGNDKLFSAESITVETNCKDCKMSVSKDNPVVSFCARPENKPVDKTAQVLEEELSNCNELLELEPDSKWCRYAKILIMKTLSMDQHYKDIIAEFEALSTLDPKRATYYMDMRSKVILEFLLQDFNSSVDLSDQNLTCVYFKERLCSAKEINLNHNKLKSVDALLPYLQSCEKLLLNGNPIEKFGQVGASSNLTQVHLKDTPLSKNDSELKCIRETNPSISFIV